MAAEDLRPEAQAQAPAPPQEAAKVEQNSELEEQLKEVGERLAKPPDDVDGLLALLDQAEALLVKVEQSPSKSMSEALKPVLSSLVAKELLGHANSDVNVFVAACISEITRVTAPEAPYDDDLMKDVFQKIVESFENLDDVSSRAYRKRVAILDTVAKVRSCVVMLDLECDDLILDMFNHFFRTISTRHSEHIFRSMETIMSLVIDESEDIPANLLMCLLQSVKKDKNAQISFRLGEKVITNCAERLKPFMMDVLKDAPVNEYSEIVRRVLQISLENVGDHEADSAGKDMVEDSKLSDRTVSDELPQGSEKSKQDVCSPKVDGASSGKTLVSNGTNSKTKGEEATISAVSNQKTGHPSGPLKKKMKSKLVKSEKSGTSKIEKPSSQSAKKEHKTAEHQKSENADPLNVDKAGKEAGTAAGSPEISTPVKNDGDAAVVTSGELLDSNRPKRARGAVKSSTNRGKTQGEHLDSSRAAEHMNSSEVKSSKQQGKIVDQSVDLKSSKKREKSASKMHEDSKSDDAMAEDVCLKEMVATTKSAAKALGKNKGNLDSGGSRKKRGQESEEIPESKKSKHLDGSIVGARIKVWWPDDNAFYNGIVDSYDPASKKHKIQYDDGDTEILVLKKERWEYISDEVKKDEEEAEELSGTDAQVEKTKSGGGKVQMQKGKSETPKSGQTNTSGGVPPKRKGWPKGVPRSKFVSPGSASKLKGKADKVEAQQSKEDAVNNDSSPVKSKVESVEASSPLKEDSVKRVKRSRDGISKSDEMSNDDLSEGGNEAKRTKTDASDETPPKAKSIEGSRPNDAPKKGRPRATDSEKSEKGDSASAKAPGSEVPAKKRGRKSQN